MRVLGVALSKRGSGCAIAGASCASFAACSGGWAFLIGMDGLWVSVVVFTLAYTAALCWVMAGVIQSGMSEVTGSDND